ncbi:hypothetical protein MIND_01188400 [Mycena indigotica]|uniref:Uncharacterized protein n=1 Tax=Mycena indigotica TaxID=2126181 RepID=A0A8H6VWN4_9AGAR|nr:uncharacterized protein MIND_01188400 [Mycena indigotica]KAF7292893.1 hypothetical protein MIND_01188400 [Mycena indigotica]
MSSVHPDHDSKLAPAGQAVDTFSETEGQLTVSYKIRPPIVLYYEKFRMDIVSATYYAYLHSSFECYIYALSRIIFDAFTASYCDNSLHPDTSIRCEQQYSFLKNAFLEEDGQLRKRCTPDFATVLTDGTLKARLLFLAEIKSLPMEGGAGNRDWFVNPDLDLVAGKITDSLQQVANQLHFAKRFFAPPEKGWFVFVICGVFWTLRYYPSDVVKHSRYRSNKQQPKMATRSEPRLPALNINAEDRDAALGRKRHRKSPTDMANAGPTDDEDNDRLGMTGSKRPRSTSPADDLDPVENSAWGSPAPKNNNPEEEDSTPEPNLRTFDPDQLDPLVSTVIFDVQSLFDEKNLGGKKPTFDNCPLNPNLHAAFEKIKTTHSDTLWAKQFKDLHWFLPAA